MFLSRCRKAVDSLAPPLGRSYRLLRDSTSRRRSIQTAYGFSLAGDPSMAGAGWEAAGIGAFLELMATHDVVIDIGANVGFYSCLAASRGLHAIAIEPSARNLNFLYRNLMDNRFENVEVLPVGLGERCGLGRIYGFGGIASFVNGWAQAGNAQSCLVPIATLDSVTSGRFRTRKLLIKMDVEGYEHAVLNGATETLAMTPGPTWLVEILLNGDVIPNGISNRFAATFEHFWRHGYRCRMLNEAFTPVNDSDVKRWVNQGYMDTDVHDFLFAIA